ncbi:MAG: hypothetical protein KF809_07835 [Chloroflexi bacterium]|nr:hypothetical protein [Chloroflexota bacterium]
MERTPVMSPERSVTPQQPMPGVSDGWRFVPLAPGPLLDPDLQLRLWPGDRALVSQGDAVGPGQPLVERPRERVRLDIPLRGEPTDLVPGAELDIEQLLTARGRPQVRPGDRVTLLYVGADRVAHAVVAREPTTILSPVAGTVVALGPGRIVVRATGLGLRGPVGWGRPVLGRLIIGVAGPDEELRASAIDIGAAGAILVAGARLDIEALTRARAIGVAGIVCGGVVARELRQLDESDERQRAALHATTPFAILALDGFGRRPIPVRAWDTLVAASTGDPVAVVPEARMVVLPPGTAPAGGRWTQDAVRVTAGEGTASVGRLVGLAGTVRRPGGTYLPGAHVVFPGTVDRPVRRTVVPLPDLERLG